MLPQLVEETSDMVLFQEIERLLIKLEYLSNHVQSVEKQYEQSLIEKNKKINELKSMVADLCGPEVPTSTKLMYSAKCKSL